MQCNSPTIGKETIFEVAIVTKLQNLKSDVHNRKDKGDQVVLIHKYAYKVKLWTETDTL